MVFRLTLAAKHNDIKSNEFEEHDMIVDRFHNVALGLDAQFFNRDPQKSDGRQQQGGGGGGVGFARVAPFESVRNAVRKSLPLIFRSEKKFLWPSWRTLNLILFYNSRQSFTENQALMWLVSSS